MYQHSPYRSTESLCAVSIIGFLSVVVFILSSSFVSAATVTRHQAPVESSAFSVTVDRTASVLTRSVRPTRPTERVRAVVSPDPAPVEVGPTDTRITLAELGLLQLAAHDFFNVDRETEVDAENGKLDLSTLLEHGEEYIALGGEPRNRENIILFSVAAAYGEQYLEYRDRGYSDEAAHGRVLHQYHRDLAQIYTKLFNERVPEPMTGAVTATENSALRTIHDFLPGTVRVAGEAFETVDPVLQGRTMTAAELAVLTNPLDGAFDPVFLDVVILIPPDMIMHIDLLERDSSFAEQFGAEHSFEHFMSELEDGEYSPDDDVMHHIRTLFAKGLYF